jgi:hypothetical protein
MLVLRPVRPVAAQALDGEVAVPLVDHFFPDGMSRMLLPVMTVPAQVDYRGIAHEEQVVRSMGSMTDCAFSFHNRFMLRLGHILSLDRVVMTAATKG